MSTQQQSANTDNSATESAIEKTTARTRKKILIYVLYKLLLTLLKFAQKKKQVNNRRHIKVRIFIRPLGI